MITIREVKKDDWDFILAVENENRNMMYSTNQISYYEHQKFMNKMITDKNYHYWLVEYNNQKVGLARLYRTDFGYAILNEFQHKKIGQAVYDLIFDEAKDLGIEKITDSIRLSNPVALYVALKKGFRVIGMVFDGDNCSYNLIKELK